MREIGGAAWDQYEKERDRLRRRLAEQLRAQMGSIVGDRAHADLLLVAADGRKLAAHRCILRQRAPGFFQRHVEPTVTAAKQLPPDALLEVAIGDVDFAGLEFFVRSVYTDDEVEQLGATNQRQENENDRDGSASRTSQHTYTMDDPPSTGDLDDERMGDGQLGDNTPMGDSMTESMDASCRESSSTPRLADQIAAVAPTMTSFRQLACESPQKELRAVGDVTPDSITQFVLSPDQGAPESPPTVADQMMGKFVRLDDIKLEEPMAAASSQEKKQIFPMFIGLDLPSRPMSLGRDLPSVMSQSFPSPVSETMSVRGRALAKRLSVTSLNSLTSIDVSPSREGLEIFPQQDKEPCSRLGADLLQMYLQQIDADVVVRSENGDLHAHKCILAATSAYFQSLLADSGATVIDLKFSRTTVDYTLSFLYGGLTYLPPEVDVWEVLSIASHLRLAELTTVARLHLRAKLCHLFHRPCAACVSAVFDALPQLHETVGLEDVFEEALAWQARYFGRIWKGRAFLHLNDRWQHVCFKYLVDNLNSETVIDVLLGCEKLQVTLPRSKATPATDAVATLVSDLLDSAMNFLANNLDEVIASQSFANQGKGLALNLNLLEDLLPSLVHTVSADLGCRVLMRLYDLLVVLTQSEHDKADKRTPSTGVHSLDSLIDEWNERFVNLVRRLYELCDTHLLHYAGSVVKCQGWKLLTPAIQQRINTTGIFVEMRQARAPPPKMSSLNRTYKRSASAGVTFTGPSLFDRARSVERSRPLSMIPQVPETPEGRESKEREDSPRQIPAPSSSARQASPINVPAHHSPTPNDPVAQQPPPPSAPDTHEREPLADNQTVADSITTVANSITVVADSITIVADSITTVPDPITTVPDTITTVPNPIATVPDPIVTATVSSERKVVDSPKSNKENKTAKKAPAATTSPTHQPKLERQGTHTVLTAPPHPQQQQQQPVTVAPVVKPDKPKSVVKPMPVVQQAQPQPAAVVSSQSSKAVAAVASSQSSKAVASPSRKPTSTPVTSTTTKSSKPSTTVVARTPAAVRSTAASASSQLPTSNLPTKRTSAVPTKTPVKSVVDSGTKAKRPLAAESANKAPTAETVRREPSTASKIPRSPKTARKTPPLPTESK